MLTNVLLKVKQYVSYKGTKREVNCSKYQRCDRYWTEKPGSEESTEKPPGSEV